MDTTPTHRTDRQHTFAVLVAGLVGLALVATMITRTSAAAFSATTDNTGNSFNGGTVTLTDDDGALALFSVDAMDPGDTATGCIEVSYDGSITTPSAVKVYAAGYTNVPGAHPASVGLSDHLLVTIEEGTGSVYNDCSAFIATGTLLTATDLTTFAASNSDYATGVGTWTPTATGETTAYRVSVEFDAAVPDTEEGAGTQDVAIVWEIQN